MKTIFEDFVAKIKKNYRIVDQDFLKKGTDIKEESVIAFHVTEVDNKESILKNGFRCEYAKSVFRGAIYFSKEVDIVVPRPGIQVNIVFLVDLIECKTVPVEFTAQEVKVFQDVLPSFIIGWVIFE